MMLRAAASALLLVIMAAPLVGLAYYVAVGRLAGPPIIDPCWSAFDRAMHDVDVEHEDRTTSPLGDRRERSCPCLWCRQATWNLDAVCDWCRSEGRT